MKFLLAFAIIFNSLIFAANSDVNSSQKKRVNEHIKKQMEKEKKYAREQTFYTKDNYDLKGAEVNPESLKTLPEIEVDDLDMDSVYD
ncbi:MAG: hypothetical protein B5M52_03990 [Helicobacteraceae bacterium 4484_230]|nr:MAG: hypothetical protein B5M52_03990 [Helicobacteraceae bacterium 4484_230]